MAQKIRADYDSIDSIKVKFQQFHERLCDCNAEITNAYQVILDGAWKGVGANAFMDEMETCINPTRKALEEAMLATQESLFAAKEIMRAAEEEVANLFTVR
jgi:WXG100 family type VII secretion target